MLHATYLSYVWLKLLLQVPPSYTFFFLAPADLKDGKRNTFNQNQAIGKLFIEVSVLILAMS